MEVRLYATLRTVAGERSVAVGPDNRTVGDVVNELCDRFPDLAERILEAGAVRPFVAVMVDGRDIRHLDGLTTPVDASSEIDIFPPVAGG